MAVHELKTLPQYFQKIHEGKKTFEVRKDDRGFRVGDVLCLREWDGAEHLFAAARGYSGRVAYFEVSYLMRGGQFGLAEDHVVLALSSNLSTLNSMDVEQHKTKRGAVTP